MRPRVFVTTAAEAAARDAAAMGARGASGIPARALMQRAGAAAAAEIVLRCRRRLLRGVAVFAGSGNNGGDAWVLAGALAAAGVSVRVHETGAAATPAARAERAAALALAGADGPTGGEALVVDGLLGTGARGAPRGDVVQTIERINALRDGAGAMVVALDVPSGVDATTGEVAGDAGAVRADLTLTFGTLKRGLLVARQHAGTIVVLDIGLGESAALDDGAARLVDRDYVTAVLPPIPADAHKGSRRHVAIVGGAGGMAGAAILAARGAMASGVGMIRLLVAADSITAAQIAAPEALARGWPDSDAAVARDLSDWADAALIGPGLGRSDDARATVTRLLERWDGPVVVDADGLNLFEGDADTLGRLLRGRPAVLTPHAAELGRLAGCSTRDVLERRFELPAELAARLGATVLLKGVPTVIADAAGARLISARGTPALATAGSGDVLGGIAVTLLAQGGDATAAAACAAWTHGRAAELASRGRAVRGVRLGEVIEALARAWPRTGARPSRHPVLAELPRVGDRV